MRTRLTDKTASEVMASTDATTEEIISNANSNPDATVEVTKDASGTEVVASVEGDKEVLPKSDSTNYGITPDPDQGLVDHSPVGKDDEKNREQQQGKVAAIKIAHDKAVKCLTASSRIFPGASEQTIVANSIDMMKFMPMAAVDSLLSRQASYANELLKKAEDQMAPEVTPEVTPEKDPVEAGAIPPQFLANIEKKKEEAKEAGETTEAPEAPEAPPVVEEKPVEAACAPKEDDEVSKMAARIAALEEENSKLKNASETAPVVATKEEEEETLEAATQARTASSNSSSLVDSIFESVIPGYQPQMSSVVGATSKTASTGGSLDDKLKLLFAGAPALRF